MAGPKQTKPLDKSLVIQKRLEGKSMNQIVKETGISKGKVQYLIKEWEEKIGSSCAEEITEFATAIIQSLIKDLLDSKSLIDIDRKEDYHDNALIQTLSIQKEKEEKQDLTDFGTSISKDTTYSNPNNNEKTTDSFIEHGTSN